MTKTALPSDLLRTAQREQETEDMVSHNKSSNKHWDMSGQKTQDTICLETFIWFTSWGRWIWHRAKTVDELLPAHAWCLTAPCSGPCSWPSSHRDTPAGPLWSGARSPPTPGRRRPQTACREMPQRSTAFKRHMKTRAENLHPKHEQNRGDKVSQSNTAQI